MVGQIFYDDKDYSVKAEWCNNNNCHIEEITPDARGRRFTIVQNVVDKKSNRIAELKTLLQKYKEDVEQVELFGMERSDYEEKKKLCADFIIELRELEKNA